MREAARQQRVRLVAVLEGGEVEQCAVVEVQLDRVGDEAEDGVAAALDRGDSLERQLGVGGGAWWLRVEMPLTLGRAGLRRGPEATASSGWDA